MVQLLSLYRYGLVFIGVLPLLLGLAIAIVPLQVGAYRIAFGRAAALSFWGWLIGSGLMIAAYAANGGPGGGNSEAVDLYLLSLALVVVSLLLGAVCVVTTALTLRTAGMTLGRMPILAWGAFVTGVMLLLSLSVLVGDLIMVYVDHHYGRLVFGGNVGVPAWLDWSVSQPQTYLYALIGLGAIGDVIPVMSKVRQPMRFTVLGALGVAAALSFGGYLQESINPDIREEAVYVVTNVVAFVPVARPARPVGAGHPQGRQAPLRLAAVLLPRRRPHGPRRRPRRRARPRSTGSTCTAPSSSSASSTTCSWPASSPASAPSCSGAPSSGAGGYRDGRCGCWPFLGLLGVILVAFPDLVLGFLDQPLGEVNFELDQETLGNILNAASFVGYLALFLTVVAFAVHGPALVRRQGPSGPRRPVGRPDARVDHHVAAALGELHRVGR